MKEVTIYRGVSPSHNIIRRLVVSDDDVVSVKKEPVVSVFNREIESEERGFVVNHPLKAGSFVAIRETHYGYGWREEKVVVVAHQLSIGGEIPESWGPLGGKFENIVDFPGRSADDHSIVFGMVRGQSKLNIFLSFERVANSLGLKKKAHPFGHLLVDGSGKAVAVSSNPVCKSGSSGRRMDLRIMGDEEFFISHGYRIVAKADCRRCGNMFLFPPKKDSQSKIQFCSDCE